MLNDVAPFPWYALLDFCGTQGHVDLSRPFLICNVIAGHSGLVFVYLALILLITGTSTLKFLASCIND